MTDALRIEFTLHAESLFLLPPPLSRHFLVRQLAPIFQYAVQRLGTDDLIVSEVPRVEPGAGYRYVIRRNAAHAGFRS
jgi:hypothetical protein